jgi:4-amino-4-deoxy-L-arabinose transferase-like glycosyltransferase
MDRPLSDLRWPAAAALAKVAASALVLASGFRAVSDDDFARTVIAEQWASAPRWDASGTSWLPFPFWITGVAMMACGRGLGTARAVAAVLGVAAAILVYLAARWLGEARGPAAAGAVVAAVFPWSARLGVATVPELPAAALTLLGMAALCATGAKERRRLWGAAALTAAALSRYEAWPVAAIFAVVCALDAARARSWRPARAAVLALSGPAAWMAWNRWAHGDELHFLARVAAYRHALGGPDESAAARIVAYPLAMVREEPEIVAVCAAAIAIVAVREGRGGLAAALGRYARPAALCAAQIAALSLAMIKDGAPTHHPERAVLAALLLVAVCAGALAARALAPPPLPAAGRGRGWALRGGVLAAVVALAALVVRPRSARETFAARGDEEAAGHAAAALSRPGEPVLVEVADYGFLAVAAALGRPEDTVPDRSVDPRDPKVPSSFDDPATISQRAARSAARWVVARVAPPALTALGEPATVRGAWAVFRVGRAP